jgi:hypothetical protein
MKILKEYAFHSFGAANGEKLPISEWADGKIRELTKGEDFNCTITTIQVKLRKYAKMNGMKVRISAKKDGVAAIVQFTKMTAAELERKRIEETPVAPVDANPAGKAKK